MRIDVVAFPVLKIESHYQSKDLISHKMGKSLGMLFDNY